MPSNLPFWIIIAIMLLASLLRFGDIDDKGLLDSDVGIYAGEAKALYLPAVWVFQNFISDDSSNFSLGNLKKFMQDRGAVFPYVGKPGHVILIALSYFIFGLNDYAVLIPSALFGTLMVWLVYLIGRELFGVTAGLMAALVLAVSRWALAFSVSGLAEMNSAFFGFLAIFIYLKTFDDDSRRRSALILAGLTYGFSIAINYKMLVLSPVFLFYEIVVLLRTYKKTGNWGFGRMMIFPAMAFLPLLIIQIPFWILSWTESARYLIDSDLSSKGFTTYFERLTSRWSGNTVTTPKYFLTYRGIFLNFELFYRFEGIIVFLATLAGSVFAIADLRKDFNMKKFIIVTMFIYMFSVWSLFTGGHPSIKAPVMYLPYIALFAGLGISRGGTMLLARVKALPTRYFHLAAGMLILIYGVWNSWGIATYKSSYKLTVDKLVLHISENGGIFTADQGSIGSLLKFYFSNAVHKNPSLSKHFLSGKGKPDSDYIVISVWDTYLATATNRENMEKVKVFKPIFETTNQFLHTFPLAFEVMYAPDDIEIRHSKPDIDKVRVYDVRVGREITPAN